MHKLRTGIIFSNIILYMVIVVILSIMVNSLFDKVFRAYVISNQNQKSTNIINLVTENCRSLYEGRNYALLEHIGMNALKNGFIITVKDVSGNILWDAWDHNGGNCVDLLQTMAENMYSVYPNFDGGYIEERVDITLDGIKSGVLDIGYYGPFYYTDNELKFLNAFNLMLVAVTILSFFIAIILGLFISNGLLKPIVNVIRAAVQITKGDFSERVLIKSKTIELNELIETINNLAETLENLEAARKRLSGDIAHEFRTPLFNLQCHIEAMIDGVWEADEERLQSCYDEIMRLNRMTGDIKKLSAFESEDLTLYKQKFKLNDLIDNIVLNFEAKCVKKQIDLNSDNGYCGYIFADRDKVSQILVNIVSNAVTYTPKGGRIQIKTEQVLATELEGEIVAISVEDTGIGISQEDLPFVFERFYRTDKSRTRSTGGSGIGLSIAKTLVTAHNGRISVSSEKGKGASFMVMLPVLE